MIALKSTCSYSETGSKTEAEGGLDQESEVGGSSSSINNMPPTMDMSVIMEQSVLVDEDTGVRPDTHMDIGESHVHGIDGCHSFASADPFMSIYVLFSC